MIVVRAKYMYMYIYIIKMLKDVCQKVEKQVQYICSKTGDEGSICAAKQRMRACNNNNMHNPIIKEI